jgi:RNA polymerase sigma-70 factor (ECF subfamily)
MATPGPSDAELILAVQRGADPRAFEELVRRHQSRVRSLLRRLVRGNATQADDLAQDTFVLAWRHLPRFRFEARFSTWLYRIAFNAWQSEARKRREMPLEVEDDGLAGTSAGSPWGQAAELPDIASRIDLERAMATLSEGERAAITACYYADLSHEEAAAALGMPLGTVKTHVLRGKAKLRKALGAERTHDA